MTRIRLLSLQRRGGPTGPRDVRVHVGRGSDTELQSVATLTLSPDESAPLREGGGAAHDLEPGLVIVIASRGQDGRAFQQLEGVASISVRQVLRGRMYAGRVYGVLKVASLGGEYTLAYEAVLDTTSAACERHEREAPQQPRRTEHDRPRRLWAVRRGSRCVPLGQPALSSMLSVSTSEGPWPTNV